MKRQEISYSRSKQTGFIKNESACTVHTSSARSPQTSPTWEGAPETEIHFPSGRLELLIGFGGLEEVPSPHFGLVSLKKRTMIGPQLQAGDQL